jgi:hypothetical protein
VRVAQILASAFFAILFLQSGIDKVVDRRGNVEWLTAHFARSPVAGHVSLMLTLLTAVELAAGGASTVGALVLAMGGAGTWALRGITLSALGLLMLFFGQRVAKDYAGAAVIATYFLLALLSLSLFPAPLP